MGKEFRFGIFCSITLVPKDVAMTCDVVPRFFLENREFDDAKKENKRNIPRIL